MSLSCRYYRVDKSGGILRLKSSMFGLVRDPFHHAMPDLADQRARLADVTVEFRDRVPIRVVRRVYFVLAFNDQGHCDVDRFRKQQWSLSA